MDNKLSLIVQFLGDDKLSGALRNMIGLGKSGDQALRGLNRQAGDLKGQMKDVAAAIAGGTGNLAHLAEKERDLAAQLARVNTQIEKQKRVNAFKGDTARIAARGGALQSSGAANVAGGIGLAAPIVLAGKAAMDFSSGMVDIQQKANLSNAETQAMARNIMAAADAAHQLPEAMRAGVDTLAGFGLDPRQAQLMIGSIGRLGTAFKVDIADGAAAAFANLNNLKVGIGETGRALDIMAAGGNAGAFEVKDMARYFPGLTAQMQSLGQSGLGAVADLTAALQIARRASGTSEEAATNVQNLLAKINSPTVIASFQKKFGVDLPAALKRAYAEGKSPMEALADVTSKALGGDLSKLGFVVEDMQAQSALRALILNMKDYRDMRAQIAQSGGTTAQAFAQREAQDASVVWQSFLGTASALAITLGTTLLPSASAFLGTINGMIQRANQWAQANPQLASGLMTLATAFIAGKVALGSFQFGFGTVLNTVATARNVFTMASSAFGGLRMAALFLAQGVMRAGAMMMANPVVLTIVAIGAAIAVVAYLVYTNWDKIRAAFQRGWQWIKSILSGAGEWMKGAGAAMMQGLLMMIDPMGLRNRLLEVARNGVAAFKNFFGIKSPSRLFMAMGGFMTSGLALGIDRGGRQPMRAIGRVAAGVAGAGTFALAAPALAGPALHPGAGPAAGALTGGAMLASVGPALAGPAMAPARLSSLSATARAPLKLEIHIHQQPGEDADALADRVMRRIEDEQRRRGLGGFGDDF